MSIEEVYNIIHSIKEGFEPAVLSCMEEHAPDMVEDVKQQLYSGQNGKGEHLSPSYDDDPYFEEKGEWYHRSADYKAWKMKETPPEPSSLLGLPPRPANVPNLFINGKFYSEINATFQGNSVVIGAGHGNGPDIVRKYGDSILDLGESAVEHFNRVFLWPRIENLFKECGYK